MRLWETSIGECLKSLLGHVDGAYSVTFIPKQDLLASGSDDATIKFWRTQTGQCLKTLRSDRPYEHMNITSVKGLTDAQKATLRELGATEKTVMEGIGQF
jgi:WD40 repeat protein